MTKDEFENILDTGCERLTAEARTTGFGSSSQFENRVREVFQELTAHDKSFEINFAPHPIFACL